MKKLLIISAVLAVCLCLEGFVTAHPKPPGTLTDQTEDERPMLQMGYFVGSADVQAPVNGEEGIFVIYDDSIPELPALHLTQWIVDGDNEMGPGNKWKDTAPLITHADSGHNPNHPIDNLKVTPLPAKDYYIQFWAKSPGDIPPGRTKVTVEANKTTFVKVAYKSAGCTFPISDIKEVSHVGTPATAASGVASGYGQIKFNDNTTGHSTSWSIDGGAWRSTGGPLVTVYATNHTIQFRANISGDTPPVTMTVSIISKQSKSFPITYP